MRYITYGSGGSHYAPPDALDGRERRPLVPLAAGVEGAAVEEVVVVPVPPLQQSVVRGQAREPDEQKAFRLQYTGSSAGLNTSIQS